MVGGDAEGALRAAERSRVIHRRAKEATHQKTGAVEGLGSPCLRQVRAQPRLSCILRIQFFEFSFWCLHILKNNSKLVEGAFVPRRVETMVVGSAD